MWLERIESAEDFEPVHFENNGWVVSAFQAAWSAVYRAESIQDGLESGVRAGNDTDTVAAIAGGVLGARLGASQLPTEWLELLHGWPALRSEGLEILVRRIESGQIDDQFDEAYRRLYVTFSKANNLDIDVDWDDWSLEQETKFSEQYRKLQVIYCREPV
jgi:hypothetical protein